MKRATAWLKLVVGGIDPEDADAVAAATSSPTPVPTEEKEIGAAYRQAAKYVRHKNFNLRKRWTLEQPMYRRLLL